MFAIYKREVKSFFTSLTAYIFIAIYLVIFGRYFKVYNLDAGMTTIGYPMLASYWVYFLFSLLTMKSLPEERKEKIDQLLFTSPVSMTKIVIGKYLAMCTVWFATFAVLCTCPLIINYFGHSELLTDYTLLVAYFFMGCVFIAVSMFISSLTESQLVAAITSLVVVFLIGVASQFSSRMTTSAYVSMIMFVGLCVILGVVAGILTRNGFFGAGITLIGSLVILLIFVINKNLFEGLIQKFIEKLALPMYLQSIVNDNMVDIRIFVFFISVAALFVFFTIQSLSKRRYS